MYKAEEGNILDKKKNEGGVPRQHFSANEAATCSGMIQVVHLTLDFVIKLIFLPQQHLKIALPLPRTNAYSRISCGTRPHVSMKSSA